MLLKVRSKSGGEGYGRREKTEPAGPTIITGSYPQVAGAVGHCFQNTHQGPRMQVLDFGSTGSCARREGIGSRPNRTDSESPLGNPTDAFIISSFSFIQPPTHPLTLFIHSCLQKGLPLWLYRLHPGLYVPSNIFLQGAIKHLRHRTFVPKWHKGVM